MCDKKTISKSSTFYISNEVLSELASYVTKEYWGNDFCFLHQYLNNCFKIQQIDKQISFISFTNETKLIFDSGLLTRHTKEPIYIMLHPYNSTTQPNIKWQIHFGSFLNKRHLIDLYNMDESNIPKFGIKKKLKKSQFNNKYSINMNVYNMVRTSKLKIKDSLNEPKLTPKEIQIMVRKSINDSLEAIKKHPTLIGKQIYVSTKKYDIEYFLPIMLTYNNKIAWFAIVLKPNKSEKQYKAMSITNIENTYFNSRLLGSVQSKWLVKLVEKMIIENEAA